MKGWKSFELDAQSQTTRAVLKSQRSTGGGGSPALGSGGGGGFGGGGCGFGGGGLPQRPRSVEARNLPGQPPMSLLASGGLGQSTAGGGQQLQQQQFLQHQQQPQQQQQKQQQQQQKQQQQQHRPSISNDNNVLLNADILCDERTQALMLAVLVTMVRNTTDENESRILYEYLAEASVVFPKVFPVIHSLIDAKINYVLANCHDHVILHAVHSIIQNMICTEEPSQQQLSYLQSIGFGGLWRFSGQFTKANQNKDHAEHFVTLLEAMVETYLPPDDLELRPAFSSVLSVAASGRNMSGSMSSLSLGSLQSPTEKMQSSRCVAAAAVVVTAGQAGLFGHFGAASSPASAAAAVATDAATLLSSRARPSVGPAAGCQPPLVTVVSHQDPCQVAAVAADVGDGRDASASNSTQPPTMSAEADEAEAAAGGGGGGLGESVYNPAAGGHINPMMSGRMADDSQD